LIEVYWRGSGADCRSDGGAVQRGLSDRFGTGPSAPGVIER